DTPRGAASGGKMAEAVGGGAGGRPGEVERHALRLAMRWPGSTAGSRKAWVRATTDALYAKIAEELADVMFRVAVVFIGCAECGRRAQSAAPTPNGGAFRCAGTDTVRRRRLR
ncbi:MAG: hypothetical protein ACREKS_10370, partial [Candidatus Rokuibacteriota bacterium]